MTKQEFESLTGMQVSEQEMWNINDLYLQVGDDITKEVFCSDYKKHHESVLLNRFAKEHEDEKNFRCTLQTEMKSVAKMLLVKAEKYDDGELEDAAYRMIGWKEAVIIKMDLKLTLTPKDIAMIAEKLR